MGSPKSQYRWNCIRLHDIFFKVFGEYFLCFCRRLNNIDSVTVFRPRCSKTNFSDPGFFWALFSIGSGNLFHRFGRRANHDDFLEEFQRTPKLVLVTLAPFGPPWGDLFVAPWLHKTWFRCGFLMNVPFWHHRFILCSEFLMNSPFWHPRCTFSLWISNELCALASQIHVFAEDF